MDSEHQIIATGYNGAPSGMPHCTDVGCQMEAGHCWRTVHAEENAVVQAARRGVSLYGTSMYVTGHPCHRCLRMLIQVGVSTLYIPRGSDHKQACGICDHFFEDALRRITIEEVDFTEN